METALHVRANAHSASPGPFPIPKLLKLYRNPACQLERSRYPRVRQGSSLHVRANTSEEHLPPYQDYFQVDTLGLR